MSSESAETAPYDVAVIGAGGAGTMAYLRAVLNGDRAVLFRGDAETKRKGRATWVAEVDNMPGLHDLRKPITATTKSTLKWIDSQDSLKAWHNVIAAKVTGARKQDGLFELDYELKKQGQQTTKARNVIVATGIMDVQPHIGDSIKPILPFANNYDVLYCIRCDGHKTIGKQLSVIGATSTAIYIGAMMVERYGHESVKILSNGLEAKYSDEAKELAAAYGMEMISDAIVGIRGQAGKSGLEGYELESGDFVETNCSIVAMGIIAYNDLITQLGGEIDDAGRAVLGEKYESNVEGLFVVGDLVKGHKMQIYTAWDEAVDAADEINRRLRMERREARLQAYREQSA